MYETTWLLPHKYLSQSHFFFRIFKDTSCLSDSYLTPTGKAGHRLWRWELMISGPKALWLRTEKGGISEPGPASHICELKRQGSPWHTVIIHLSRTPENGSSFFWCPYFLDSQAFIPCYFYYTAYWRQIFVQYLSEGHAWSMSHSLDTNPDLLTIILLCHARNSIPLGIIFSSHDSSFTVRLHWHFSVD